MHSLSSVAGTGPLPPSFGGAERRLGHPWLIHLDWHSTHVDTKLYSSSSCRGLVADCLPYDKTLERENIRDWCWLFEILRCLTFRLKQLQPLYITYPNPSIHSQQPRPPTTLSCPPFDQGYISFSLDSWLIISSHLDGTSPPRWFPDLGFRWTKSSWKPE